MLRPIAALLALLAASPVAALSVSASSCNDQSAQLVSDDGDTTLTLNGEEVPLEPDFAYENLLCVSRDGDTLFGLTRLSERGEETYLLLDPETRELAEITFEEAGKLDFWEDEDDWGLDLLDD